MADKRKLIDVNEITKKAVPHTRGSFGYSANIRDWAVLVGDIQDAVAIVGVYLTQEEYEELLEYKLMYEDLCK